MGSDEKGRGDHWGSSRNEINPEGHGAITKCPSEQENPGLGNVKIKNKN